MIVATLYKAIIIKPQAIHNGWNDLSNNCINIDRESTAAWGKPMLRLRG